MLKFIIFVTVLLAIFFAFYFLILYEIEQEAPTFREGLGEFRQERTRVTRMVESIKDFFKGISDRISGFFQAIGTWLKKAIEWLKNNLRLKTQKWLQERKTDVKEGLEEEKQEVKQEIGNVFSRTWDWFKGKLRAALD